MDHLALARQKRKERHDFQLFEDLIAAPFDFGSLVAEAVSPALTLPGSGQLGISHSAALSAGDITVSSGIAKAFTTPDQAADIVWPGFWGEKTHLVTLTRGTGGNAGTITLYLRGPLGRWFAIGTATFT